MITVFGSSLCPDTRAALELYKENEIDVTFKNFTEDLSLLKEFLAIRDTSSLFDDVRKNKGLGIPLILLEDGTMTHNPAEAIK